MRHHVHIGAGVGCWEQRTLFFRADCSCGWRSDRFDKRDDATEAAAAHRGKMAQEGSAS